MFIVGSLFYWLMSEMLKRCTFFALKTKIIKAHIPNAMPNPYPTDNCILSPPFCTGATIRYDVQTVVMKQAGTDSNQWNLPFLAKYIAAVHKMTVARI